MRHLVLAIALLAALTAAAPAAASTTVSLTPGALVITDDDAASTLRVTAPNAGSLAVEVVSGSVTPPPPVCTADGNTITCPARPDVTVSLGGGDDDYKASIDQPQTLDGGPGDDKVETGYGNDTVAGGDGDDDLNGFRGDDRVDGGPGNDKVDGWDGSDTVVGGPGADTLLGDGATIYPVGNDVVEARDGEADSVDCGGGADRAIVDAVDVVAGCAAVDRPAGPAGPGPGPGPGGSNPTPVLPAPTAPTVVEAKPRTPPRLGRLARGAALQTDVTASTACTARVSLRVGAAQARQLGLARKTRILGTSRPAPLAAGEPSRVSVTVKRSLRKRLRKARRVRATLTVDCGAGATDATRVTLRR